MNDKITESERGPKCPVCGYVCDDVGDYAYVDNGEQEWECDECGATCIVIGETYTTFEYTTKLISAAPTAKGE